MSRHDQHDESGGGAQDIHNVFAELKAGRVDGRLVIDLS
jgi:D-arabinose 1-dehydrogenase-like Zn-dependent alcohol dehydrogenase